MRTALLLLLFLLGLLCSVAAGQTLRVTTKDSPPFAYRNHAGEWTGISIDLWDELAAQLELEYRLKPRPRNR